MNEIQKFLESESYIILDGAMGTMLMDAGLESGAPPEEWNVLYPDRVRAVHRLYIEAGSRLILSNSFGGTRFRLKLHNLHDRVIELNKAAAANARAEATAAPQQVLVGGSMGPTGELIAPLGTMSFEQARDAFAEQAKGLAEGGVDVLWVETMSDIQEVVAAVEGARQVTDLPIVATMTFDTNGHTMMGVSPETAVEELAKLDLAALGGNCGNGPDEIEGVIRTMNAISPDLLFVAKSNAGLPKWVNEQLLYDGTPEVMAEYALRVRGLGASLIGACCGSSPAHIRAMSEALAAVSQERLAQLGESAEAASEEPPQKRERERKFQRKRN